MTRFIYSKEENRQAPLQAEAPASNEAEQILHLKRLLVTLKQYYEKNLQQLQIQLQSEHDQRLIIQKELEQVQIQLTESQKFHEEEEQALRNQQTTLKELLKKTQDELVCSPASLDLTNLEANHPILRDRKEKESIQDKYEQLKEEWKQLSEQLESAIEMRLQADQYLNELEGIAANQENELQKFTQQLQIIHQEKETLENEKKQFKNLLDESEMRLKVAQQHLAKKVKETTLLSEKLKEQQATLTDFVQTIESQKTQIAQLQASMDLYQKQEKRLQQQLHETLKGTESQVVKWEEKYFRIHDKWQESENRIRELKKFEEKHLQMQSLLANLGNFMGGALNSSHALFHTEQEATEHLSTQSSFSTETSSVEEGPLPEASKNESREERYDLFGMRQPLDKSSPPSFT